MHAAALAPGEAVWAAAARTLFLCEKGHSLPLLHPPAVQWNLQGIFFLSEDAPGDFDDFRFFSDFFFLSLSEDAGVALREEPLGA